MSSNCDTRADRDPTRDVRECRSDLPSWLASNLCRRQSAQSLVTDCVNSELTEVDEQVSPASTLSHRQGHDTADIIGRTPFLLGKVADKLGTGSFCSRHDVKQERFDVVVQRFVVEKHFRK